jgi:hypothetical protein
MSARSLICWPMRRSREAESTRTNPPPTLVADAFANDTLGTASSMLTLGPATVTATGWPRPARRDPLTTAPDGQGAADRDPAGARRMVGAGRGSSCASPDTTRKANAQPGR